MQIDFDDLSVSEMYNIGRLMTFGIELKEDYGTLDDGSEYQRYVLFDKNGERLATISDDQTLLGFTDGLTVALIHSDCLDKKFNNPFKEKRNANRL